MVGFKMESNNKDNADLKWRNLAMQFDGHRMEAIWHLKELMNNPEGHREAVEKFLAAPPLSGEEVLVARIKEITSEKK
jgi:hypothetical protein